MTRGARTALGDRVLMVMTKASVPGAVKTRLCPPLTPAAAARLHHCFLLDTLEKTRDLADTDIVIAYTPADSLNFFTKIASHAKLFVAQSGDHLGVRMSRCFEELCDGRRAVVMIGADIPTLPTSIIDQAFDILAARTADLVIGPSTDGGYYLVGMILPHFEIFRDIDWSTSTVLAQSAERASKLGLCVSFLAEWYDIDIPEDLTRLVNEVDDWHADYGRMPVHTAQHLMSFKGNLTQRRIRRSRPN